MSSSSLLSPAKSPPAIALEIAARLGAGLPAEAVYLFGSHARGDSSPDSDYDFLAIVPESARSRYERHVRARSLVAAQRVPKDIVVLTREEWTAELAVPCSLASTVQREGVKLYG
jgi:predicted nucleotidyltransferase